MGPRGDRLARSSMPCSVKVEPKHFESLS
jgi:hypothetical protein